MLRETFSEVENFTVLMDRFKNKLDSKVEQVRDQIMVEGQMPPIQEEPLQSAEEQQEIEQLKNLHQE